MRNRKMTIFDIVLVIAMTVLCILTVYPVVYVLFASVSDPLLLETQRGILWKPLGFSLEAYKLVMKNPSVLIGYRNTILYVVVGTSLNMVLTILGAYALSRKDLFIQKPLMVLIVFTMQFGGGLIPTFVIVDKILGNSVLTQIVPGAIATYNLIILRSAMSSIPASLEEAAEIDGAGEWSILTQVVLPLAKPSLAVVALYYGAAHWNQWLPASMYLRDRNLYPLQLFLREILLQNQQEEMVVGVVSGFKANMGEVINYATIIVSIVPMLCIYPFLQKYFVKGTMLGAVKE